MKRVVFLFCAFLSFLSAEVDLKAQAEEGFKAVKAKDYAKAAELLKKPCDSGINVACAFLAASIYEKEGKATKEVVLAHEKACGPGHEILANSCGLASRAYAEGNGVAVNLDKAIELLEKACKYGDKRGCEIEKKLKQTKQNASKSINVQVGQPDKAVKDYQSIEKELESSCNANDLNACYELGKMRLQGSFSVGTEIFGKLDFKEQRDMKILEKACDGGVLGACNNLGFVYSITNNYAKANKYFKPACDKGNMVACGNYGEALKALGNDNEGKAYIKKACESEIRTFCRNLGITFILE